MSHPISMPDLIERVLRQCPHKGKTTKTIGLTRELGIPQSTIHSWLVSRVSTPGGMATLKLLEWVERKEKGERGEEMSKSKNQKRAIKELKEQQGNTDREVAHAKADLILCGLLESLGLSDVVKEYDKIKKWYA